jgi:hypothetical protein
VADLQGSIDRTVPGCLETEPALRPPSALAVAASCRVVIPWPRWRRRGDTTAGDGRGGGRKDAGVLRFAWAALALVLIGMPLAVHAMGPLFLLDAVPLEKPPEVLADRASELCDSLGAPARPAWRAYGFRYADGRQHRGRRRDPGAPPSSSGIGRARARSTRSTRWGPSPCSIRRPPSPAW